MHIAEKAQKNHNSFYSFNWNTFVQPNNVIGLSITKNKHNMKKKFGEMLNVSEI